MRVYVEMTYRTTGGAELQYNHTLEADTLETGHKAAIDWLKADKRRHVARVVYSRAAPMTGG